MNMKHQKGLALRGAALAVMSVVFLLLYSSATSPLTNYYAGDSAFFMLVGQGMTRGMLPYRDFFDMKGPYLFLIEYIGQLICYGRTGAFIMQCINMFISLWIIDCIYRMMFGSTKRTFLWEMLLMLPCLFVAAFTFEGGNLTEEFSLPWLLLAVYFALGYFRTSDAQKRYAHPLRIGFYYGFSFGVLALIRVTNAAIIGAIILTIAIGLLVKKEIKNLLLNGAAFILGCAAAFAPMCIFFACHGLLGQMLSQVFLFGVQYSSELSLYVKLVNFAESMLRCVLWAALPMVVLTVYRVRNWRYWVFSISAFLLLLVATVMGNAYLHYFILGIPNLVLGLALLVEQVVRADSTCRKRRLIEHTAMALLLALIFIPQWPFFHSRTSDSKYRIETAAVTAKVDPEITDIKSHIPAEDYDSVYVYGVPSCSNWYAQAGLFPAHRYCDWQRHYIELNPQIGNELEAWLNARTAKWVVTPAGSSISPAQISDAISNNYHVYAQNGSYVLYRANDNAESEELK